MAAKIINGRAVSDEILEDLARQVADLQATGWPSKLVSIRAGENPAVDLYVRNQKRKAKRPESLSRKS